MRIGLLTSELSHHNGWAHYSLSMAKALKNNGVKVKIVAARNSSKIAGLEILPILPTVTPPDKNTLLQLARSFFQVRQFLADCAVIHSTVEIYAPLAAAIAGNRPLFMTAHGSYINLPKIRRWPINWLYRSAFQKSTIVCVSQYTAKVAQNLLPPARTVVIPNAVDASRFASLPDVSKEKTRPTVISSGGVKARKGTLALVRAMAKVRNVFPDVHCVIIGNTKAEPDYTEKVQAEIEALSLQDTVQLLGFVNEKTVLYWFAMADVLALSSINTDWKFEGFGLVHLEASAAGLPVIGTRDCGAEDAIEHGVTGLLVNQAKIEEELPDAIIEILSNSEKAREMGLAGKQKAQVQTWDKVAQELIELYTQQI